MEKLAGDLLLGLKFVKLEILSTSFIDFLYDKLGELSSRSLGLKFVRLEILSTSLIDFLSDKLGEFKVKIFGPQGLKVQAETVLTLHNSLSLRSGVFINY